MKNLILLISFSFLFTQTIHAQYLPIVKENAKWSAYSTSGVLGTSLTRGYYNMIKGDTIINGLSYKKVFHKDTWHETRYWDEWTGATISIVYGNSNESEEFIGVIREDTTARKVYFMGLSESLPCLYDLPQNEEYLLYDFDVDIEVGDTLYLGSQSISWPLVQIVQHISTVQYSDNVVRKKYGMQNNSYVEGVGGYNGLFGSIDIGQEALAISCWMNCYSDNNNYLIGDGYFPCDSIEAGVYNDVEDVNQITWTSKVSPNPFHDNFNVVINSADFQTINFRVLDLLGHEVFDKDLSLANQTVEIPTENWESGFYTIVLTNKDANKRIHKVMKY